MSYKEVHQLDEDEAKEHPLNILSVGKNTKDAEGKEKEELLAILKQEFI